MSLDKRAQIAQNLASIGISIVKNGILGLLLEPQEKSLHIDLEGSIRYNERDIKCKKNQ